MILYTCIILLFWEIRRATCNIHLTEVTHLPSHDFMGITFCSSHQEQVEILYFPVLTYTSKQADKARSSNHFRNKDKQFNPYYIIHWIQLISSKVTPESKIVLALHYIYSYEGITGNQDSLLRALLRTLVTSVLYTFILKTSLKPWPKFYHQPFSYFIQKLFHSDFTVTFTIFLLPDIKTWVSCIEQWLVVLV